MKKSKVILGFIVLALLGLQLAGCSNAQQVKAVARPEAITIGIQAIPNDEVLAKAKG